MFVSHIKNGIPIIPFFGDKDDEELLKLLNFLIFLVSIREKNLRKELINCHFKTFLLFQNLPHFEVLDIMLPLK